MSKRSQPEHRKTVLIVAATNADSFIASILMSWNIAFSYVREGVETKDIRIQPVASIREARMCESDIGVAVLGIGFEKRHTEAFLERLGRLPCLWLDNHPGWPAEDFGIYLSVDPSAQTVTEMVCPIERLETFCPWAPSPFRRLQALA